MVGHQELTDVAVNEHREVEVGEKADLRTVSGAANLRQSTMTDVSGATKSFLGERITPTSINKLRSNIRSSLLSDPQIGDVHHVEITTVDKETNTVEVDVSASPYDDFELTLP